MSSKRKGLLTLAEIVANIPVRLPFNPCTLRQVYAIEYSEAVRCIGIDLWKAMVDAVADYSDAKEFDPAVTYQAGDVVKWKGNYRTAKSETTEQPSVSCDWEDAKKFSGDCADEYDDFYCTFLLPYLAYSVLAVRFPYIVTQITDGGLEYSGRKYNIQDLENQSGLKKAIFRDRQSALNVMRHYLSAKVEEDGDCFNGWSEAEDSSKTTSCGCKKKSCPKCNDGTQRVGRYRFG